MNPDSRKPKRPSVLSPIDRRRFLKHTVLGATTLSLARRQQAELQAAEDATQPVSSNGPVGIIDTNVNLFEWPFRALKYRDTGALVAKLRKHRVIEAWAGSFEALFAKDMNGVNERLTAECRERGPGFLIPFGSVNLAWPDWEEDVRRCHEVHQMPGIRIFPGYQPFDLDHPAMERLIQMTAERKLLLQVVFGMEDPRVHHPNIRVGPVTFRSLLRALDAAPEAKVELLHVPGSIPGGGLPEFMGRVNSLMDISRLEGNGALARTLGTVAGLPLDRVPIDHLVFGSHAPFFPVETALLKLMESPLGAEQLQAIMHGNARRLLPRAG